MPPGHWFKMGISILPATLHTATQVGRLVRLAMPADKQARTE
jgi:hypothetical protein